MRDHVEDVSRDCGEDFRIDRACGIGGLVEVRVGPAADHGDGRDAGLLERNVIATRKKAEEIDSICQSCLLPNLLGERFLHAGESDGEASVSYCCVVDVDHRRGRAQRHDRLVDIER